VCGLARELDRPPRQAEMRRKTSPAAMGTGDTFFGVTPEVVRLFVCHMQLDLAPAL
jgi:hypothetical protein